jgi:dTDP-4-dehydrorhamnose 3,5-epimerase
MKFIPTDLPGVMLIEPQVFGDHRGFFMETWHRDKFANGGLDVRFVQDNHSRSTRGILRGLHIQIKRAQGKLVRVATGEIFDVAVDLRQDSPHFGKWSGCVLSESNKHQLWIPPGFGHGFYTLSESADVIYKCTEYYAPEHERTLRWDDPDVGIHWPLVNAAAPMLSAKDSAGLGLNELRQMLVLV